MDTSTETLLREDEIHDKIHDAEPQIICHRCRGRRRSLLLPLTAGVLFILLLIVSALNLRLHSQIQIVPREQLNCGNSVQEARARGCEYDDLAKAWLPAACSRYGGKEFVDVGSSWNRNNGTGWLYFEDKAGTRELTIDGMAALADQAAAGRRWYGSGREHATHCAWNLLRMADAYVEGLRLDHLTGDFGHAKHCVKTLLDKAYDSPTIDEITTVGNIVFGHC